ncbi:hypothetical protein BKA62DRAFT_830893 [Auriculariales sp. MPI-PUGE-AT-0066]|nr:hypothetical protein BKA62DRAFT_830893 [Auriculariales sp. MPI-PUGE-AT-0066]
MSIPPAVLGGLPTNSVDTPICAVLMVCFLAGAVTHMRIFRGNISQHGRRFVPSAMTFGFCMARLTALSMRIAWANHPHSSGTRIAAIVLTAAGVVLLFVLNLIYAYRVFLGYQQLTRPRLVGALFWALRFSIFSIVAMIISVIVTTIISFNTTNPSLLLKCRNAQRTGATFFAVLSFVPLPLSLLAVTLPHPAGIKSFGFGSATIRRKLAVVVAAATILCLGASFRAGTSFKPRPGTNPAWYHHKACYYVFNFVLELMVVALYAIARVDRLFYMEEEKKLTGNESNEALEKAERRP